MKESVFEKEIYPAVLANEAACRILIDRLIERGCTISKDHKTLTHDECIEVALSVWTELTMRETEPVNADEKGSAE